MSDAITVVANRIEFLEQLPKNAVCAEVGVYLGGLTTEILQRTLPRMLHLIDPWRATDCGAYYGMHPQVWEGIYEGLLKVHGANDRVEIHRGLSEEILPDFEDASLDWIYIDGNHHFPFVAADIAQARRIVRPGGLVCGHDLQLPGVRRAVLDALNAGWCKMRILDTVPFVSWAMERIE